MSTTQACTTPATEAEEAATTLRAAAAWLDLAADELEAGHYTAAASRAKLGHFGATGSVERIEALKGDAR